jgi:hypothetical protein
MTHQLIRVEPHNLKDGFADGFTVSSEQTFIDAELINNKSVVKKPVVPIQRRNSFYVVGTIIGFAMIMTGVFLISYIDAYNWNNSSLPPSKTAFLSVVKTISFIMLMIGALSVITFPTIRGMIWLDGGFEKEKDK